MHVHCCLFDRECRALGAPKRLHIVTKHFGALLVGARAQAWLPFYGYSTRRWTWWWVSWHPTSERARRKNAARWHARRVKAGLVPAARTAQADRTP